MARDQFGEYTRYKGFTIRPKGKGKTRDYWVMGLGYFKTLAGAKKYITEHIAKEHGGHKPRPRKRSR